MKMIKLLSLSILVSVLLAISAPPALADWFYNTNSGNYWYCAYYGSEYWCLMETGQWIRANPNAMDTQNWWVPA